MLFIPAVIALFKADISSSDVPLIKRANLLSISMVLGILSPHGRCKVLFAPPSKSPARPPTTSSGTPSAAILLPHLSNQNFAGIMVPHLDAVHRRGQCWLGPIMA